MASAPAAPPAGARIAALGTYVPERVITNDDMARMVDTTDEWIVRRTGIRERHAAAPSEFTSDLCIAAARDLLSRHPVDPAEIDFVVACTSTPDYAFPSVACIVQDKLGLPLHAGAIDLNATCAGFMYGLHTANALVSSGMHRRVLVVAGETLSKVTDFTDRTTCVLFGDGAGAAIVEPAPVSQFRATLVGSYGAGAAHLYRTGLSNCLGDGSGPGLIHQNGREVYRWAVETVVAGVGTLLDKAGLTPATLDWFVPHSANARILEAVCERVGIPPDRTLSSIEWYGNTSAATIPLALAPALKDGRVKPGQTVLMYGFGGGLVHAGAVVDW